MVNRALSTVVASCLLAWQCAALPAQAENRMGYRLLSQQEAAGLPHNQGSLGMNIERAQQITDDGMTFELIRVKQVRQGSPGAQAGFKAGDQIIAVDGQVFPSLATFASYVGSKPAGSQISVDYIPAGGGPQQAQRVAVVVGAAGRPAQAMVSGQATAPASTGMSTGTKVAIGVGAAALFGCYEMGCFSHRHATATSNTGQQVQQPHGLQQQR
ncbi:PDZ domain-containing protein [Rhodopila sp.]|uniref:PDZ domain-containing protein n=1 Tax=Rhodopila sp. TaxID=2480087 RepID=UPI003D13F6E4